MNEKMKMEASAAKCPYCGSEDISASGSGTLACCSSCKSVWGPEGTK